VLQAIDEIWQEIDELPDSIFEEFTDPEGALEQFSLLAQPCLYHVRRMLAKGSENANSTTSSPITYHTEKYQSPLRVT
jgi:hypothetical protein